MSFFNGKVAVVTGGSRGLGFLIARELHRNGAKVAIVARSREELARAKAELSDDVLTIPADLTDLPQIQSVVHQTLESFGKIDILINNAGIIEVGPLQHMKREDFERSMQLHFWVPFELIQQVIPHMRRQHGGRIVNIASIGGKIAVPHMAAYSSSKFALVGLSDAFRSELARENIFVTTVTPGLMRTGSDIHAKFKGDRASEFQAFSTASKLPFASMSAERAARKIVTACRRGQPALVMPFSARLGILGSAIFPNLSGRILRWVNKRLAAPVGPAGDEPRPGSEFQ